MMFDEFIPDEVFEQKDEGYGPGDLLVEDLKPRWNEELNRLDEEFPGWRSEKALWLVLLAVRYHFVVRSFSPLIIADRRGNSLGDAGKYIEGCLEEDRMPFCC